MTEWMRGLGAEERRAFIAAFGGWTMDAMDYMVFSFVIPTLLTMWGISQGEAGLLATVTLLVSAFGGWIAGSLADRFKDLDPAAHVYAKTGSLGGVKSLSGYAITAKGEPLVFSILTNNFSVPSKRVTDAIDSIVEACVNSHAK